MLALTGAAQVPVVEPGVSHELAVWRAARYSDVRYKLNLTLEKMSPVLKGTIEIKVKVSESRPVGIASGFPPPIILDWRKLPGHEKLSTVSNVTLNGSAVVLSSNFSWPPPAQMPAKAGTQNEYYEASDHLIFNGGVIQGENVITLDFTSPILTSGSAITRYIDKEDGAEYIYSLFVPSDASTAFPVFDQPDLKARFLLGATFPQSWKIVSNTTPVDVASSARVVLGQKIVIDPQSIIFAETKPISTYVFAFAAGPWERVSVPPAVAGGLTQQPQDGVRRDPGKPPPPTANLQPPATAGGTDKTEPILTSIYVRKSQAAKFKPHAAQVFRLTREGVKFLETYFDHKFPFSKYDIVLVPEFPFGGMEHAGATFLREASVIFPQEPTKNDYISRANLIFHETAHQWFGDTVTMRWFDDLWLKEGFAEFMAYKTLEKVMPEYNAWKVFYERNKQAAYLTDSTRGTTPIYQPIANLSNAKSAYGNIVYRKAPSFLRQAEFFLGPDKFQTAVRAFLKKHEYANAGWEDLVREFEAASGQELKEWADFWVKRPGLVKIRISQTDPKTPPRQIPGYITRSPDWVTVFQTEGFPPNTKQPLMKGMMYALGSYRAETVEMGWQLPESLSKDFTPVMYEHFFTFPNYQDYAYGIFLLDDKSRDYVLKNIQNEKDDFLRTMMWGSLWDSVREGELDPVQYVELVIKNLAPRRLVLSSDSSRPPVTTRPAKAGTQNDVTQPAGEIDESTIQTLLGRVSTAMNYYVGDTQRAALTPKVEAVLIDRMQNASTPGQRITYYRSFLNIASTENARRIMKVILKGSAGRNAGNLAGPTAAGPTQAGQMPEFQPRTKDRFDIVTRLIILGDPEAPRLLAALEKTETSDEAKRYAYAARAGMATAENKAKLWTDYTTNTEISESWLESSLGPFNSIRQSELTLPYLERALAELPRLKRSRKIFFVNGWLGAFIGGQRSEAALAIVNKFLADNPNLDRDLRLKILENVDLIERAVKIRGKYGSL